MCFSPRNRRFWSDFQKNFSTGRDPQKSQNRKNGLFGPDFRYVPGVKIEFPVKHLLLPYTGRKVGCGVDPPFLGGTCPNRAAETPKPKNRKVRNAKNDPQNRPNRANRAKIFF